MQAVKMWSFVFMTMDLISGFVASSHACVRTPN
jgi:hypothetical protein